MRPPTSETPPLSTHTQTGASSYICPGLFMQSQLSLQTTTQRRKPQIRPRDSWDTHLPALHLHSFLPKIKRESTPRSLGRLTPKTGGAPENWPSSPEVLPYSPPRQMVLQIDGTSPQTHSSPREMAPTPHSGHNPSSLSLHTAVAASASRASPRPPAQRA